MWSDVLSTTEAEYTRFVLSELRAVHWAQRLFAKIGSANKLCSENKPLLFEARYAYELYRAGVEPEYEYAASVSDSTVDFRIRGSTDWLVELVSLRESNAVKQATRQVSDHLYERVLSTDAEHSTQSEEGEMIKAQERIGEKVFRNGAPTKFPLPNSAYHAILVDMRGLYGAGGDAHDYRHITYGVDGLPAEDREFLIRWWTSPDGKREPIKGLFEKGNPMKAAQFVQQRIHFIGFVEEKEYREGEIVEASLYLSNPWLFPSDEQAAGAFGSYPLKQGARRSLPNGA